MTLEEDLDASGPEVGIARFNITILGNFNPAIIQPDWAISQRLLPASEYEILAPLPLVGAYLTYRMEGLPLGWLCTQERLVVFGDVGACARFVSKVIGLLPHTPLRAAGVNFRRERAYMQGRLREQAPNLSPLMASARAEESGQWVVLKLRDGVRLTIRKLWQHKLRQAQYNFHVESTSWKRIVAHVGEAGNFSQQVEQLEEAD